MTAGTKWDAAEAPALRRRAAAAPVEARLRECMLSFEDALRRTSVAADGEAIHDMRVAARRLIEFLRMWRPLFADRCVRRIVRGVRALRRRAGRTRDLEVQVGMLRERLGPLDAPDGEALELLRDLEARLERWRRRAGKRAGGRRSRRLLARLSEAANGMSGDLLSHLEAFEAAHAREQARRVAAIEALRTSLESGDDAELHRIRLTIKKWRYAVESIGENGAPILGALRQLQEALGSILDRAALRGVLAKRLGRTGPDGATPTFSYFIADLDAERSERLQRFRALGAEFLRPATGLQDREAERIGAE